MKSNSSRRRQQQQVLPPLSQSPPRTHKSIKCINCQTQSVTTACLTCQLLLCISCALQHSKNNANHEVLDAKEAFKKVREQAKAMEVKLRQICQEVKASKVNYQKNKIDGRFFEEQLSKVKLIREKIEDSLAKCFDQIAVQFAQLWDSYIETWGSGQVMLERVSQLQSKLQTFILNDTGQDHIVLICDIFSNMVIDECKRVFASYERKNATQTKPEESVLPPRLLFDYGLINSVAAQFSEIVQVSDWQVITIDKHTEVHPLLEINMDSFKRTEEHLLPVLPMSCPFLYLYDPATRQYQVGEFEDTSLETMPHFIKTVFVTGGDLLIVGGADENGMPVKSNLLFQCSTGVLLAKEPLPHPKNPAIGLVHIDGMVYVIGGMRIEDEKYSWSKSCEVYSLELNQWRALADMKQRKPQQTVFRFNQYLYAMGLPVASEKSNIERYDISHDSWKSIELSSLSQNPFNFAAAYTAVQINSRSVLIFGGKTYHTDQNGELQLDGQPHRTVYIFEGESEKFVSQGAKYLGTGVTFGEFTPFVLNKKVIYFESPIAKLNKLHRWFQVIQCLEVVNTQHGLSMEMVQLMTSE